MKFQHALNTGLSNSPLTIEILKEYLSYDPENGFFTKIKRTPGHKGKIGTFAGCRSDGFRYIRINGGKYRTKQLVWLYMTGRWPEFELEHINGTTYDNRWENLRESIST